MAALALPCLPTNQGSDYVLLIEFLQAKYPKYEFVFVIEQEHLLNENREWTPMLVNGLRLWALRRAA